MPLFKTVKANLKFEVTTISHIKIILDKMPSSSNLLVYFKICFQVIVINMYFKNTLISL